VLSFAGTENALSQKRNSAINWRLSMKVKDALFIFGLVFIGIPLIGLATVVVSACMGMI
jgi:hypothetical protein